METWHQQGFNNLGWKQWRNWCNQRRIDFHKASEKDIVNYLLYLADLGKSYSVINTHRSMLSQTMQMCGVQACKDSVLISRVMKGLFNRNPPLPCYVGTWDVLLVFNYIQSLPSGTDISLRDLSMKLVTLVALTTAQRVQTLGALDIDYMHQSADGSSYTFMIKDLLKTSRPGHLGQSLKLFKFVDVKLCVVSTLESYLKATKDRRKSRKLFVSFKTFEAVSASTPARWVKSVLHTAGVDNCFKVHSVRGACLNLSCVCMWRTYGGHFAYG
ncbi:uncharacterized protein LOC117319285 isoform X1 [Pecten maximus]|uniref:uncharacterized protein LOC117319285 isoform X1 n=1 Tax=Pecten maximus TaxID=6579 RepID=UPI001458D05A|nr:uncharacterized protein LOC117319285 isoform X1 [Pecten maximus]